MRKTTNRKFSGKRRGYSDNSNSNSNNNDGRFGVLIVLLFLSFTFPNQQMRGVQSFSPVAAPRLCDQRAPFHNNNNNNNNNFPSFRCSQTATGSRRTPFSTRSPLALPPPVIRSQRNSDNDNDNDSDEIRGIPLQQFFRRSGRRSEKDGGSCGSGDGDDDDAVVRGYVPSGMSRAEYSSLLKKESERERKKNYGAWGPRFRRTDRPDGDWMAMPNLWTSGIVNNNNNNNNGIRTTTTRTHIANALDRIRSLRREHGQAFLIGYVLVDSVCFGYTLWRLFQRTQRDRVAFLRTGAHSLVYYVLCRLVLSSLRVGSFLFRGRSGGGGNSALAAATTVAASSKGRHTNAVAAAATNPPSVETEALKIALAVLQIPLWNTLMERATSRSGGNGSDRRRWPWLSSKKRFAAVVTTSATAAVLTVFGIAFFLLPPPMPMPMPR